MNKSETIYYVIYNRTKSSYLFNHKENSWAPGSFLFNQGNIFEVFSKDSIFQNVQSASAAFADVVKKHPEEQFVIREISVHMEISLL